MGVAQGYVDYGRWPIVVCGGGAVFSLGVAQGYVDYGLWPNVVCGGGAVFPWALPRAMLTMTVGQMWCVVASVSVVCRLAILNRGADGQWWPSRVHEHPRFLYRSLRRWGESGFVATLFTGATSKHLRREKMAEVTFLIPPT